VGARLLFAACGFAPPMNQIAPNQAPLMNSETNQAPPRFVIRSFVIRI
jgi:hypothetical protein